VLASAAQEFGNPSGELETARAHSCVRYLFTGKLAL
jgi:hypothetical protein